MKQIGDGLRLMRVPGVDADHVLLLRRLDARSVLGHDSVHDIVGGVDRFACSRCCWVTGSMSNQMIRNRAWPWAATSRQASRRNRREAASSMMTLRPWVRAFRARAWAI